LYAVTGVQTCALPIYQIINALAGRPQSHKPLQVNTA